MSYSSPDVLKDRTSEIDPEYDYLREQIRKLVQFVAQLLGHPPADHLARQARDELAAEAGQLLGHPYEVLGRLTPASAALLLRRDPERIAAYAEVLAAESRLLAHAGDVESARDRAARSRAMTAEMTSALGYTPTITPTSQLN